MGVAGWVKTVIIFKMYTKPDKDATFGAWPTYTVSIVSHQSRV